MRIPDLSTQRHFQIMFFGAERMTGSPENDLDPAELLAYVHHRSALRVKHVIQHFGGECATLPSEPSFP